MKRTITKLDWASLFGGYSRWIFRRIQPDVTEFYNDDINNWITSMEYLSQFEDEIYAKYFSKDKDITPQQWRKMCIKYLNKAKKMDNFEMGNLFFDIYEDCPETLNELDYIKPATKEEIEQARKDFSIVEDERIEGGKIIHNHTFSDNAKVLEYQGVRMIIDNEWGTAWYKDEKGIHSFDIVWDWNFPIDEYFLLYKHPWTKFKK